MSKWRFYGREEEFERLEETLRFRGDPGNFASVRILGRAVSEKPSSCGKPL